MLASQHSPKTHSSAPTTPSRACCAVLQQIANIQSGNFCMPRCDEPWTEVQFGSPTEGNIKLLVAPLFRLTRVKNATVRTTAQAAASTSRTPGTAKTHTAVHFVARTGRALCCQHPLLALRQLTTQHSALLPAPYFLCPLSPLPPGGAGGNAHRGHRQDGCIHHWPGCGPRSHYLRHCKAAGAFAAPPPRTLPQHCPPPH